MAQRRISDKNRSVNEKKYLKKDTSEQFDRQPEKKMARYPETSHRRDVPQSQRVEAAIQARKDASDQNKRLTSIEGFEKLGPKEDKEIKDFLAKEIPGKHMDQDRIEHITYKDRFDFNEKGEQRLGVWHHNSRDNTSYIEINQHGMRHDQAEINMVKETASHEVGHDVFQRMNSDKRAEWDSISGRRSGRDCVTPYARESAAEDFAESYSFYINHGNELKNINKDKHEFMKNEVFHERTYRT